MSNNLEEDSIPEDFKRYLGSSLANGYYLDDDAREKQFEKIVERVGALINQKEKELLERVEEAIERVETQIGFDDGLPSDLVVFNQGQRKAIKQLKEELNKKGK